ncbi:MAG: DUF4326 domain-containing protein [Pseudomonadota bacterium]
MTAPIRLQLSRKKGFRLQDHSKSINGLEAVNVARPSKWGNRFRVGEPIWPRRKGATAQEAVDAYRRFECIGPAFGSMVVRELKGKNLACWCPIGSPCHADVLLEIANGPAVRPVEEGE